MIKLIFTILLVACSTLAPAQIKQSVVDKVKTYPSSFRQYEKLAEKIKHNFKTDHDRAAAIFAWIALNIKYDVKAYYSNQQRSVSYTYSSQEEKEKKERELQEKIARQTLSKSKALCQGYSELYRILCLSCNIECEVISGYSKTLPRDIGKTPKYSDHAWNAIKLDEQWYLLDVTWGAGTVNYQTAKFIADYSPYYFLCPPELFFLNHYPDNEQWLLCKKTKNDFIEQALYHGAYLNSAARIVSPQKGIITKANNRIIKIEISNASPHKKYGYYFSNQHYAEPVKGKRIGDNLVLSIPVGNRKSGYLDIIVDSETIVTYKLKLR